MRRTDVLERCRLAAEAIQKLPHREWAGWICWMMEALDEEGFDDQEMLEAVRDDVISRVEKGRW